MSSFVKNCITYANQSPLNTASLILIPLMPRPLSVTGRTPAKKGPLHLSTQQSHHPLFAVLLFQFLFQYHSTGIHFLKPLHQKRVPFLISLQNRPDLRPGAWPKRSFTPSGEPAGLIFQLLWHTGPYQSRIFRSFRN